MTGAEAEAVIAKVRELKEIRDALWAATEKLSLLRGHALRKAAEHISLVINDLEASL